MRVVVIGAGIAGLSQALAASGQGHEVVLFERGPRAIGASVRNFGMFWPIGQPTSELYRLALRSRAIWNTLARDAGIWLNPCGAVFLAHRDDEFAVLREFAARAADLASPCELLTRDGVLDRASGVNPSGLIGGLWSQTEAGINPRAACEQFASYLARERGVTLHFSTTIVAVQPGCVTAACGERYPCDRVIVCGGADIDTLYPDMLRRAGLKMCKLQMFRTGTQPGAWRLRTHLASGLTLRHYHIFGHCPSLPALRARVAAETPELDRYGIHVMASQNELGEVVLGDSHEYDRDISIFDKAEIDELILRELRKVCDLPDWTVAERWHGIYAKHPSQPYVHLRPADGVEIVTGFGGGGMTLAPGAAEAMWAGCPAAEAAAR
jgi:FAD dependent oxidoreductase TIGR03364